MKTFFSSLLIVFATLFAAPAFSANLPSGYTELEYIESTGTQYIDTGIVPSVAKATEINLDVAVVSIPSSGGYYGFGSNTNLNVVMASGALGKWRFNGFQTDQTIIENLLTTITLKQTQSGRVAILNNVSYQGSSGEQANSFWLGKLSGTELAENGSFKYGRCSIKENGALVRDFVPAIRNSDSAIGMYDTVGNRFYTNQGTGAFTAGPVVLNPCRNLLNPATTTDGWYIDASGNVQSSNILKYSALIPVVVGKTYTWSGNNNSSTATNKRLHGYDSNGNWVEQLHVTNVQTAPYSVTATIPSGVAFVRLSGIRTDKPDTNVQFEQGSTATDYVPYNASCHNTNAIKIATTAYNAARFNPVKTDLNNAVATIRDIVTKTINQTAAIASLQADKQTRPEDACPAGKKCLLVETEENGVIVPHWFPIVENIYGLPAGYTALEYIQSDGNSWIDTGIKGNMSYKYDIEFQQLDAGAYRNWGAFNQETFNGGPNMSLTYAGDGFLVRWTVSANGQQYVNGLSSFDTNRHHLVIDNGYVTWDGVAKGRSTGHRDNYILSYNLFLGTINPGGTTPTSNAKSKYYSYKVWNTDGNLIQNFVPAKNSSGVIGMYDTVNDRFYTNAGTGTFTAGPEI